MLLLIWNEAEDSFQRGNYQNAERKYTEFINKLETTNVYQQIIRSKRLSLAYNNRGLAKYKQVCFDDAMDDYNKAVYHDPQLAIAYYNRATIHYRMGEFKQAADDFTQTLQLNPTFNEANEALLKTVEQLVKPIKLE